MQAALETMAFLVVAVAHVPVLMLMHQADGRAAGGAPGAEPSRHGFPIDAECFVDAIVSR